MKLLKNFAPKRALKSGCHDKIMCILAKLERCLTPEQEFLLIDRGNAEELIFYFERFYFNKRNENYFFRTASYELCLKYLQQCIRNEVPLQNEDTACTIIQGTNYEFNNGGHELIMQLLYLMKATSFCLDANSEFALVCRGSEPEILAYIQQRSLFPESEALFLKTVSSQLVDLYSAYYSWNTENIVMTIRENWSEFVRYYDIRKNCRNSNLKPDEEKALLTYGKADFVRDYLQKGLLSENSFDFLALRCNDNYFETWLDTNNVLSVQTFASLLEKNEERAVKYLAKLHANVTLSNKAEKVLLSIGTTKEVLAYISRFGLLSDSFKLLLKRNISEEITAYTEKHELLADQFLQLLSRGDEKEITHCVSVCTNLSSENQMFLIGRGHTEEIKAWLKNRRRRLSPQAVLAIKLRGISEEQELLPNDKI